MKDHFQISDDPQVNKLLNEVVTKLKDYTEKQTSRLNELTNIGVALSSERNIDKLLEMIVDKARHFTNADGGTLYLVSDDEQYLAFSIVQTESLGFRMGGASGTEVTLKPIPLHLEDGSPNNANVCAYVANSRKEVNIPDVYEVEGFDFTGAKMFDKANNYRSKSQLVIPMTDHEGEVIGVLQLINARDPLNGETIEFAQEYQMLSAALASQAAVAIDNTKLIQGLQELFESFIKTIATAIDEKSPYTGGHIERVANLTMDIAERINQTKEGVYADVEFSTDQMYELRLAAWLHDTGKITTPEYVVDKRTKLETIFDREALVRLRIELAMAQERLKACQRAHVNASHPEEALDRNKTQKELEDKIAQLKDDLAFIIGTNFTAEFVPDEKIEKLEKLAKTQIETSSGPEPLLHENELYNLSVRKGNLTKEERKIIENHVVMTYNLLEQLPFPKKLRDVPFIAGAHHEKLNGKGYPNGLTAEQIPLQVRIMTLADIFEALTAKDRPYKDPKKMSEVLRILGFMVKDYELDPDLVDFFLNEKMHIDYAKEHLADFQLDLDE